jgi:hypothetical protein
MGLPDMRLWNEQYLVEAFLIFNKKFKIIGALKFLKHRYPKELARCCPLLGDQIELLEPSLVLAKTSLIIYRFRRLRNPALDA